MKNNEKKGRIFICGGGTGGHLYPALAIGQKLRQKNPGLEIIFIGSQRPVEKEIMAKYKEKFIGLRLTGLKGKGWRAIFEIFLVPRAVWQSIYLIIKYRPGLVIGVGGYSSGPMILASWILRKPRIILEQNVRPGFTNRFLRCFVPRVVTAFEATLPFFGQKGAFLGNPVRPAFYAIEPKKERFPFTLLIFGGSQGSRFLNQLMTSTLPLLKEVKNKIHIIHQTGSQDHPWVKKIYLDQSFDSAEVEPFFFEMPEKFAQADFIICRAGATSLAEIIASRRTALLIPFAQAAENHQYWNAFELFSCGAADMMTENEAKPEKLAEKILDYLEHPEKVEAIEARLAEFRISEPEEKIASFCLELMGKKEKRASHG